MNNMTKIKMPRTRAEFEEMLMDAFLSGCTHGYSVEHTENVSEQERIGALEYIGLITKEEANERLAQIRGY